MDQIKIGKFIEENRKEKGLTQSELAKKLGITDRAVSKWENGRGLPDHSLLLDLTNILGISVNELLLGEYIKDTDYKSSAEDNLISLASSSEYFNKELTMLEKSMCVIQIIIIVVMISLFILNMVLNYMYGDAYDGKFFKFISPLLIVLSFADLFYMSVLRFHEKYKIVDRKKK